MMLLIKENCIFLFISILFLFSCNPYISNQNDNRAVSDGENLVISPPFPLENISNHNENRSSYPWSLVSLPVSEATAAKTFIENNPEIITIWKWNHNLQTWETYPKQGDYTEIEYVTPNDGYWIRAEGDFELTGDSVETNDYTFSEGWNLIGYTHSGESIAIDDFFSQGDFWQNSCSDEEPIINVWGWENNSWKIYFPKEGGLEQFNQNHQTNFDAFDIVHPGSGMWVNANRGNDPSSGNCSMVKLPVIEGNHFYLDGEEFRVKSIGLELFMPGENPGGINSIPDDIDHAWAMEKIKELNANTVYTNFGVAQALQEDFFVEAERQDLFIILGIWFSGEANDYNGHSGDFQNSYFKEHVKSLFRSFVDRIHTGFSKDYSERILYINIGNEFSENVVRSTNTSHSDIDYYEGTYYSSPSGAGATAAFLAEMADYLKTYEMDNYQTSHNIAHHTWPVVTPALLDPSFLDIITVNLYSYWPDFVSSHSPGSHTGTPYQGALEELATPYPDKPFIVSEFGMSNAPDHTHGYTTDEAGQGLELKNRWEDITTASSWIAGGSIHEFMDQWWKNDYWNSSDYQSEFEHDRDDQEEWFGLIEVGGLLESPEFKEKSAFETVAEFYNE
jgi:hypothetical protein